jgi:predicted nucleotide-binding protein (sugar kinase/HSP70/actin superfamily)
MFPHFTRKLLSEHGKGLERTSVYLGDMIFQDFSLPTSVHACLAYMFGGLVRKMGCMTRPYEKKPGTTDKAIAWAMAALYDAFRHGKPKEPVVREIVRAFERIEVGERNRPKVAIFGDFYVRDNEVMNQGLIRTVEANGGEVISTSFSEFLTIMLDPFLADDWRRRLTACISP